MFLNAVRLKKCVILLILILLQLNMLLNAKRLKKYVIKQIIDVLFMFDSIPDQCKTQEICEASCFFVSFLTVYCPDKYITQEMYGKTIDDSLAALKLIPDWFVTSKVKKLYTALDADDGLLFFIEDSGHVIVVVKCVFLV